MDNAFANLLSWFTNPEPGVWNKMHKPFTFEEALLRASKLCSSNPAEVLGIYSSNKVEKNNNFIPTGSIDINKRADIVITNIFKDKTKYKLKIDKVLSNGNLLSNGKLIN
jgi:hypothetical protein